MTEVIRDISFGGKKTHISARQGGDGDGELLVRDDRLALFQDLKNCHVNERKEKRNRTDVDWLYVLSCFTCS